MDREALELALQNIVIKILEEYYQDNPPTIDAKEFNEERAVDIADAIAEFLDGKYVSVEDEK